MYLFEKNTNDLNSIKNHMPVDENWKKK